jgi:sterol desaturase/sphingolipid hydroxylase (fatty acid hydroxylase superfamily)
LDLRTIIGGVLSPVMDLTWSPSSKVYWIYLCFAFLIAAVVYFRSAASPSLRGALEFILPKSVYTHASAIADYKIWAVNGFLFIVVYFPYFALSTYTVANATQGALRAISGLPGLGWEVNWKTTALYTVFDLLAVDFALFLAHYLQHRIPVLWEFHKTHHSAEVMTPVTVVRMHPVDQILNFTMVAAFPGFTVGVFSFLYAQPVHALAISGVNIGLYLFYIAGISLRHSHIWIMYPAWIARHISSPAMHLIHHSKDPKHADKNLAQMFNFWDRLAGTLYLPTEKEAIEFGLWNDESKKFRSLSDLYVQPFKGIWERARQRRSVSAAARHRLAARD